MQLVPDAYPLAVKIRNNTTFEYVENINDKDEDDEHPFDAKALVGIVTEALADKEREIRRCTSRLGKGEGRAN